MASALCSAATLCKVGNVLCSSVVLIPSGYHPEIEEQRKRGGTAALEGLFYFLPSTTNCFACEKRDKLSHSHGSLLEGSTRLTCLSQGLAPSLSIQHPVPDTLCPQVSRCLLAVMLALALALHAAVSPSRSAADVQLMCWLDAGCVRASAAICSVQGREHSVLALCGLSVQHTAGALVKRGAAMEPGVPWQGRQGGRLLSVGAAGRSSCSIGSESAGPPWYTAGHEQPLFWCLHHFAPENYTR